MNEADDPSPLDVLLAAMLERLREGDLDAAARYARDAAPYQHARVASSRAAPTNSDVRTLDDSALPKPDLDFLRRFLRDDDARHRGGAGNGRDPAPREDADRPA